MTSEISKYGNIGNITSEDMPEVGQGIHAMVKRAGVSLVVKFPKRRACGHHDNEKKIHESLGEHPSILH